MFGFFKVVSAIILSLFFAVVNPLLTVKEYKIPEPKSVEELSVLADIFTDVELADEVLLVKSGNFWDENRFMMIALQGLANREKATVCVNGSSLTLSYIQNEGSRIVRTDADGNEWTMKTILQKCIDLGLVTDNGYVLYSSSLDVNQLNLATNYATVYGWLPVPAELESLAVEAGLTKKADLSVTKCDYAQQLAFYDEHKDFFRNDALVHQYSPADGLRDLAIQQKIFVMYTTEPDFVGQCMRNYILKDFEKGSVVLGWCSNEIAYVESVTAMGHYVIPSDYCFNNSFTIALTAEPLTVEPKNYDNLNLDPTKHYVALVYSDGDNAQWIQNGFPDYYNWQTNAQIDVPVSWTYAPHMYEFSVGEHNRVLQNLGNDCLVTGPSGAGYTRLSQMYGEGLEAFSDITAATMLKNGITTVTLLDRIAENKITEKAFVNKLGYFARYDNIRGGILQLDSDRYASGKGKVYFVNDKPFISVRLSLWHPSSDMAQVTNEWIEEQADIINAYKADIHSIDGYSVINIHPWTINPESFRYFVSCLDENVEVIPADALIAAIDQNIPHNNAQPE